MLARAACLVLLAGASAACPTYEYEHEIWLRVDGSGTVNVTGRPALWTAFKGLGDARDPDATATPDAARVLFERSGLRVRRATLTRRAGQPYLFVSADFDDVNALAATPAFPDLALSLRRASGRLHLEGRWSLPPTAPDVGGRDREGLMAVRFHLPSKVYSHDNAADGVERGNIVGWRQDVAAARDGRPLAVGAVMDERSILLSTVVLFGGAIALAVAILALTFWVVARRGRRDLAKAERERDESSASPG
jgi:hypothetical protein